MQSIKTACLLKTEAGLNTVMQEQGKPKHQFLKTEAKLNATGAGKQKKPEQGRKQRLPLKCISPSHAALTK